MPTANLIYTVVTSAVGYVEFNFQPWLKTYKRFILYFNNVDYTSFNTTKYYYLTFSYNTTGSQSFGNSPGYQFGYPGVLSYQYSTGNYTTTYYLSGPLMANYALQRSTNTNYTNPYGWIEIPNPYLTGIGGYINTEINYIMSSGYTERDRNTESNNPVYSVAGIRFYSSYNNSGLTINQGTFTLYGLDPI
jgi:hypothetical protein